MPFISGFTRGIAQGLQQTREENQRRSERENDREFRLLDALAKSDDPEIASMALAGMLDHQTGKPAKGLRGFLGEMQGHPALPTIQQLIRSGKQVPDADPTSQTTSQAPTAFPEQTLASAQTVGGVATPAGQTPAAMSRSSAVTPGAPPLRMGFHTVPRQVFLTPEERAGREAEATVTGKLSAFRAGMRQAKTPEEQELVRNLSGGPRRTASYKPVTLELDNGDGTTSMTAGYFDQAGGGYYDDAYTPLSNVKRIVPNTGGSTNPNAGLRGVKVKDPTSPTGWSQEYHHPDGSVAYVVKGATPYTPPPAFSGTTTIEDPDSGDATVSGIPRGGGAPVPLGTRPAPAGAPSTDQALAQGVIQAIDKAIADSRIPGVPLTPGMRERLVKQFNDRYGKTWTYEQWAAQAKIPTPAAGVSGGPPPPPRGRGKGPAGAKSKGTTSDPDDLRKYLPKPGG